MLAIIDYEAGNLTSVKRAVDSLGYDCTITRDPAVVKKADRVIFPGVGAAGASMTNIKRLGLDRAMRDVVERGVPLLGICVGTQIIFEYSEEDGGTECLGLLPGRVVRFEPDLVENGQRLKVPHMGWNQVRLDRDHPVIQGIEPDHEFYFVHAYYAVPADPSHVVGWTDYGSAFASIVARKNLAAVQFHSEKSGRPGLQILKNFCNWDGRDA